MHEMSGKLVYAVADYATLTWCEVRQQFNGSFNASVSQAVACREMVGHERHESYGLSSEQNAKNFVARWWGVGS